MKGKSGRAKPVLIGILAGAALLAVYFLIVSLANSFSHAISEFARLSAWIYALVAGFGLQVGLYAHIRESFNARRLAGATTSVAAAGGASTTAMVACCAHHLADVLPIIGLSAAAVFLNRYQEAFLLSGVVSNAIGTIMMLRIMQSNALYDTKKGLLKEVFRLNMKAVLYAAVPLGIAMVALKFLNVF